VTREEPPPPGSSADKPVFRLSSDEIARYNRSSQRAIDERRRGATDKHGDRVPAPTRPANRHTALIDSTGQAAIDLGLVAHNWNSIDPYVFAEFGRRSAESVDNAWDLTRVIYEHPSQYSGYLHDSAPKFAGFVAEHMQAADIAASNDVHLFDTTGHPGSDAIINGHEVNFKNYVDAHQLSEHFAKYPHIPALVNGDIANPPADALHLYPGDHIDFSQLPDQGAVIINHGVQYHQALDAVQHTAHVVDSYGIESFDLPGVEHLQFLEHFQHLEHLSGASPIPLPIGALVVSSIRERNIYLKGNKDRAAKARLAKNVAIDVGGAGAGMAMGAGRGASIGGQVSPGLGHVVGGVVGGIIGGVAGRSWAKDVRERPLREAVERYEAAVEAYQQREADVAVQAEDEWHAARDAIQVEIDRSLDTLVKQAAAAAQGIYHTAQGEIAINETVASEVLAEAAALGHSKWSSPVRPYFWSRDIRENARLWDESGNDLILNWDDNPYRADDLYDIVLCAPGTRAMVTSRTMHLRKVDTYCATALEQEQTNLTIACGKVATSADKAACDALEHIKKVSRELMIEVNQAVTEAGEHLESEVTLAGKAAQPKTEQD
jgi:hypothetical protein